MPEVTKQKLIVDSCTKDLPFRVYDKNTEGNIGFFFAEADARLFAAAPDLAKALQGLLDVFEFYKEPEKVAAAAEAARTALAKVAAC